MGAEDQKSFSSRSLLFESVTFVPACLATLGQLAYSRLLLRYFQDSVRNLLLAPGFSELCADFCL